MGYIYLLFLFIYLKTSKEKKVENLIKFYNVKGIFYSAENKNKCKHLNNSFKNNAILSQEDQKFNFRNNININLY